MKLHLYITQQTKQEKAKKIFKELIENKMEMPKWIKPLAKKY